MYARVRVHTRKTLSYEGRLFLVKISIPSFSRRVFPGVGPYQPLREYLTPFASSFSSLLYDDRPWYRLTSRTPNFALASF